MSKQIEPPLILMQPMAKKSYGFHNGTSDPMSSNLKALSTWQDQQVTLNNSMGGGSSTDGYTKVEVPQTDVFNPAGPDGPNTASQGVNLNNLTAQNQGIYDKLAFQQNGPTYNPPPAPVPEKLLDSDNKKGGTKKIKRKKSLTKKAFCKFAKKRSYQRIGFLKDFRKASKKAHNTRKKHINQHCMNKKNLYFCKTVKSFSRKRFNSDNKFTRKELKEAFKRHSILFKYCKDKYH